MALVETGCADSRPGGGSGDNGTCCTIVVYFAFRLHRDKRWCKLRLGGREARLKSRT